MTASPSLLLQDSLSTSVTFWGLNLIYAIKSGCAGDHNISHISYHHAGVSTTDAMSGGVPATFNRLKAVKLNGLKVQSYYSPYVAPWTSDLDIFERGFHPLRAKKIDTLANTPENTLRWHITTRPSTKALPKAVLRSSLRSKWTRAMMTALRQRGYLKDGTRLDDTVHLYGTLELVVHGGVGFTQSDDWLLGQTSMIVEALASGRMRAGYRFGAQATLRGFQFPNRPRSSQR